MGYTRIRGAFRNVGHEIGRDTIKRIASAERFVRAIKFECLAQIIPLGERRLRTAVKEYTERYHFEQNHQGRNNELIEKPNDELHMNGAVECREELGGVLKDYSRRAA